VRLEECVPRYGVGYSYTSVGRYSSIKPNSRIVIQNFLTSEAGQKNSTKIEFIEFTSMEI
jgi:hypothetical protein